MALSSGFFTEKTHFTTYDFISPLKLDLVGKKVIVTGTVWENGVGHATSLAFARAGASAIAMADQYDVSDKLVEKVKSAATQAGRKEPQVLSCTVEIAAQESVQKLHDTVSQIFDEYLDIVVNNVAYMEPDKPILDSDLES